MSKFKIILALVVLLGYVFFSAEQYRAINRLRMENESLRSQLAQSQLEREQLANAVPTNSPLAPTQLAELLKLRNEVTQLREQTNQAAALRRENEGLQASLKEVKSSWLNNPVKKNPEDALPQDIHPKESWAFRGYGTPEATVETLHWAMMKGDKETFLAGVAQELRAKLESDLSGKDFAKEMGASQTTEFRILDRQVLSDDEMVVTVYYTRQDANGNNAGNSDDTIFKRIDGQWKVADPVGK